MSNQKLPVIVLNMGPNGLGVTRSLGRLGIDVYGVDWKAAPVGFASKYCKKAFQHANPIREPELALKQLLELGATFDTQVVLMATADFYMSFVSRYREALSRKFLFNIPDTQLLENLVDKTWQYKLCDDLGIPIARTISPTTVEELREMVSQVVFPVMIKGRDSHLWYEMFQCKGWQCENADELTARFETARARGIEPLIQEIIVGPNRNHFKVCAYFSKTPERKMLALFSTEKRRQFPADFGIGSCMVSRRDEAQIELGLRFLNGIGYTGVGSIEFKKDDRDGKFKLIELNPRFWQQNIQATEAGVNFAEVYYRDMCGEAVEPQLTFKDGVEWLDLNQDFQSFLANRRKGDVTTGEWLRSLTQVKCSPYFAFDDIGPMVKHSNYGLTYLRAPLRLPAKLMG